jgi:hypothetical protein
LVHAKPCVSSTRTSSQNEFLVRLNPGKTPHCGFQADLNLLHSTPIADAGRFTKGLAAATNATLGAFDSARPIKPASHVSCQCKSVVRLAVDPNAKPNYLTQIYTYGGLCI